MAQSIPITPSTCLSSSQKLPPPDTPREAASVPLSSPKLTQVQEHWMQELCEASVVTATLGPKGGRHTIWRSKMAPLVT